MLRPRDVQHNRRRIRRLLLESLESRQMLTPLYGFVTSVDSKAEGQSGFAYIQRTSNSSNNFNHEVSFTYKIVGTAKVGQDHTLPGGGSYTFDAQLPNEALEDHHWQLIIPFQAKVDDLFEGGPTGEAETYEIVVTSYDSVEEYELATEEAPWEGGIVDIDSPPPFTYPPCTTCGGGSRPLTTPNTVQSPDLFPISPIQRNPPPQAPSSPPIVNFRAPFDMPGPGPYNQTPPIVNPDVANRPAPLPPGPVNFFGPSGFSSHPVRYFDGAVLVSSTDLMSGAAGIPWGVTREWTNAPAYALQHSLGSGMVAIEQPQLMLVDSDSLVLISNGHTAMGYDWDANSESYKPAGFLQDTIIPVSAATGDELIRIDTTGTKMVFHSFDPTEVPAAKRGQLKRFEDAYGNSITFTYSTSTGNLTEVLRASTVASTTITESFLYTYSAYVAQGNNDSVGLVSSVLLRRNENSGSWTSIRKVVYEYYGANEDHGNQWDLKTAKIYEIVGQNSNLLDTTYYRYYTPDDIENEEEELIGYVHGLKYVFYPESFARLTAAHGSDLTEIDDDDARAFADHYFEYDEDQRATKEIAQGAGCGCSAGLGTFEYDYNDRTDDQGYVEGYNSWAMETTETLPDGNQNIIYTNFAGQVMLQVFREHPGASQKDWATFFYYDDSGRVLFRADPSAVSDFDDDEADLIGWNLQENFLRDDAGHFTEFTYYAQTDLEYGWVAGYLEQVAIHEGELGDHIVQSRQTYTSHEDYLGNTIYLPAETTTYAEEDTTGDLESSFSYTYYYDQFQQDNLKIKSQTTTDPSGASTIVIYDTYGRPIWKKDAEQYIHHTVYDQKTGAIEKTITDVDTDDTADEPDDWVTRLDAGLHLVTAYEVDELGRPTRITDANGNITYTVYRDPQHEVRVYPAWDTNHPTGPTIVLREDRALSYTEILTMGTAPNVENGRPKGDEAISLVSTLSRTHLNDAGQPVFVDDYFSFNSLAYSTSSSLGTLNTHFYRTELAYDSRGRQDKTLRGDGTIFRTVFDGLGRPVSEWIGTDDEPETGNWSPTNTAGTNMIKLKAYEFDDGDPGDSYLTSVTETIDAESEYRQTCITYDFRGRPTHTVLPNPDGACHESESPIYLTEYDNLGRMKEATDSLGNVTTYAYDTENRAVQITLPDPDGNGQFPPINTLQYEGRGLLSNLSDVSLNRLTTYVFDGAGRPVRTYEIVANGPDPYTEHEYDAVGNLVLTRDASGNETEYVYDKANRLKQVIQADPDGAGPLERPTTDYFPDQLGRLTEMHDPLGNVSHWGYDALGRVTGDPNGNIYAYDAANRVVTLQHSTEGTYIIEFEYNLLDQVTTEFWSHGGPPVLTVSFEYDDAGQLIEASAPAATYSYQRDALGRVTKETQSIDGLTFDIEYDSEYTETGFRTDLYATIDDEEDFHNIYVPDDLQRLASITQKGVTGGHAVAEKRIDSTYNLAGQFQTISRYANSAGTSHVATSHYAYDGLGRLGSLIHTNSTSTPPTSGWGSGTHAGYRYTFDDASRIDSINSYLDGLTSYGYDDTNQLIEADHSTQSGMTDEEYSYDENGNRTMTGYEIELNNRLIYDGTYRYDYDGVGNRSGRLNLATGDYTVYTWDNRNRLTKVTDHNGIPDDDPQAPIADGSIEFDGEYYDANLEEWVSANPWTLNYQIMAIEAIEGNSIELFAAFAATTSEVELEFHTQHHSAAAGVDYTTTSGTFAPNSNPPWLWLGSIPTFSDQSLEYNERFYIDVEIANCLYTQCTNSFEPLRVTIYDQDDNAVIHDVEYAYDVFNQLVRRTIDTDGEGSGQPTDTFYSHENGQIVLQFDGDEPDDLSHRFVWNPAAVDQLLADEQLPPPPAQGRATADWDGNVVWPLADHLGTIRDIADRNESTGVTTVTNHRQYDSYGNLVDESNPAVDLLFGFTGLLWDEATKIQSSRERWYDPSIGRFISQDPIGLAAGDPNFYRYVGNNPISFTDPSGLIIADPRPVDHHGVGGSRIGNNMPTVLPGSWRVYLCVESGIPGHAWITYEQLDTNGNPTGKYHTASKYPAGRGGASSPGSQWDLPIDRRRWEGGRFRSKSKTVTNPTPFPSPGYSPYGNNCTTYARNAWFRYTGEFIPFPPYVHIPWWLDAELEIQEEEGWLFTIPGY